MATSSHRPPLADTAPPVRYAPDPLVVAGADWTRRKGIPNHLKSVLRVADHAHVINCMFDMNTLVAIVVEGPAGYQAKVVPVSDDSCEMCALRRAPAIPAEDEVREDLREKLDGGHYWPDLKTWCFIFGEDYDEHRANDLAVMEAASTRWKAGCAR